MDLLLTLCFLHPERVIGFSVMSAAAVIGRFPLGGCV